MSFNFMAAVTICSDFGALKSDSVSTVSPSISHELMGPDAMIFSFNIRLKIEWCKLNFETAFFLGGGGGSLFLF